MGIITIIGLICLMIEDTYKPRLDYIVSHNGWGLLLWYNKLEDTEVVGRTYKKILESKRK